MSVRIPPEMTSIGMPSRYASPMPLIACVMPAAGTIARTPIGIADTADGIRHECGTHLVGDEHRPYRLRRLQLVVQLDVVYTRNTEREFGANILECMAHQPCGRLFHAPLCMSTANDG